MSTLAIPERYLRLFTPELESGEQVRAVANADLWLRYRRLALTDRRLLVVERGGVRSPFRGRRVQSIPLDEIASVTIAGNPVQWSVRVYTRAGRTHGFALPSMSKGTARFATALRSAIAGRAPA